MCICTVFAPCTVSFPLLISDPQDYRVLLVMTVADEEYVVTKAYNYRLRL